MRAVVITRTGPPEVLEVREVADPRPGPGEILVRVRGAGVNRADLLQRRGAYPAPPPAPADIPGLEYAGEVVAAGPAASRWRIGDRVMGIVAGGAQAELVAVAETTAVPIPEGIPFVEAGAVPEVFMTAYDALFRQMSLRTGERLLIHAVGSGVGTAALQLAHAAGAFVIGTSRTATKLERARSLGLDVAVDTSRERFPDAVARASGGGGGAGGAGGGVAGSAGSPGSAAGGGGGASAGAAGMDVVLDLLGAPLSDNLAALSPGGRMIVVGTMGGRAAELNLALLMTKRLTILGTTLRGRSTDEKAALARDFEREVLPLFARGAVRPVVDRVLPASGAAEAHRLLESNATFGKVVLVWE